VHDVVDAILETELDDDDRATCFAEDLGCFLIRTQVVRVYTVSVGKERMPAASS